MKKYVISSYMEEHLAMYESNDCRLDALEMRIEGTFKRDKSVKGLINGAEVGLFTTPIGVEYIIFSDHSALEIIYWTAPVGSFDDFDQPINDVIIDGKTIRGPWALMSEDSHRVHGMGLGVGRGQKYKKLPNGKWMLISGN